jgi:predicted DNA-binding transcriptional regulator YafY
MLLQARGRMTASNLAVELEVTKRTIYRDIDALCTAGVPVYTERGPGGGISLVEQYRSDLTGLTNKEIRALFMMGMPPAMAELGLDQDLKAAFLKLAASLPTDFRWDEQRVRQRIHIDLAPWQPQNVGAPPANLSILHQGVWDALELEIIYMTFLPTGLDPVRSIVCPYGLVAKREHWYLVGKRRDHLVVIRVDRVQQATTTGKSFIRPDDFDLVHFWDAWCQRNQEDRNSFVVCLMVSPQVNTNLSYFFGDRILQMNPPEVDGWRRIEVAYEYHEQARSLLLALGGAVKILEPIALRYSVQDYAQQIINRYANWV